MGIKYIHNWLAIFCVLVLAACSTLGQFSHKKPWPTYSLQNMPQTRFTCHDKILGGYYADPETQCQMFHVCVKVAGVGTQDFRFLCPNATAFDQEAQICADWGDVDCEQAVLYYGSDNFDLYRLGSGFESKRAPLAEEEEATFHLQRADTGDIRQSKETRVDQKVRPETQSYTKKYESTTRGLFNEGNSENRKSNYDQNNDFSRVTQKPKKTTSSYYTTPTANDFHNYADAKQDADDLFKGSHSSNFFSNRNSGREDDFYDTKPSKTTTTTTTTPRPYNPMNQFFNGNAPQSDFSDYNKSPDATSKRPHRGRRPIPTQNNPNSLITNPTSRPTTTSTTYGTTTVPNIPKSTKRLTLQTSFNAGLNSGNDQFYNFRSTSPSSTTASTTTPATFQRNAVQNQKFQTGGNDYQQHIQPTTYSPSAAFRYKSTTSKYDDINETALRGEKPGQSTFINSQYENQELEIFNRVTSRKSQNTERNIQKQQAKDTPLANRNEFTDFTKNKTPSGFQIPSKTPPAQTSSINLGLNVQPLDPSKLNSELRNINQTQQPHRGRVSISRFNDRQQTEPQYFRTKPHEAPAPFAVPQSQQQQAQKKIDINVSESPQKEFSRIKGESKTGSATDEVSKPFDATFNAYTSPQRPRLEQRTGTDTNTGSQSQSSTSFNGYNSPQNTRARAEQRIGGAVNAEPQQQQSSKQFDSNLNGYNSPQREISKTRSEQRTGDSLSESPTKPFKQFESNFNEYKNIQRDHSRVRPESRTGSTINAGYESTTQQQQTPKQFESNFNGYKNPQRDISRSRTTNAGFESTTQQQQAPKHFESSFNAYNSPQREFSRTRAEPRTGIVSNADSYPQNDYNRIKSDFSSTTGTSISDAKPSRGRGRINYRATTQHQGRSLDNYVQSTTSGVKKFSTLVPKDQYYPTTFKPTTYKKVFEKKPTKHVDPKLRGTPYTSNTTPLPSKTSQSQSNTPDEDDGQYHPELYEVDYSGNNVTPTKRPAPQTPSYSEPSFISTPQQRPQPLANAQTTQSPQSHLQSQQQSAFQKQSQQPQNHFQQQQQKYPIATPTDLSDEEELFKTAHSLNLGAASINKLRADTLKTADKTPHQSSLNFGFDKSTITSVPSTGTSTTTWRPTTSFIATTTTVRTPVPAKKPKKSSASKRPPHADADTSYDYAYYDTLSETPQEYSEYDVISEFRKTKNH